MAVIEGLAKMGDIENFIPGYRISKISQIGRKLKN